MKRKECITSSTTAAIQDMKEFMDYQLELFKVETEEMLAQTIKQLKEIAAEDSAKARKKKKAERMRKAAGQAQSQKCSQSAGSATDAVADDDIEAEQERNASISSNKEGENEREIEDAGMEGLSPGNGQRKSRRTIKEPAWMKDFI